MPSHIIQSRPARGAVGDLRPERDPDRLRSYLEDAAHVPGGHADAVYFPRTEADVAAILRDGHPVLVIGAQSSLTGGATPMGEAVLSTARMDHLEAESGRVTTGPGVTLAALEAALGVRHEWYPPVPTFTGATVGGVVSTNAAGAATFKYGPTRPWVQAMTVVLAGGDVLDIRRGEIRAHEDGFLEIQQRSGTTRVPLPRYRMPRVPKVSAGYFVESGMDLIDLFIGAEGTLGVVVSVTLETRSPRPAACRAMVQCRTPAEGLRLAGRLRSTSSIDVSAIEHMDGRSLDLLRFDGADVRNGVRLSLDCALMLLVTLEVGAGLDNARAFDEIAHALEDGARETPLVGFCRVLADVGLLDRTEIALPEDGARHAEFAGLREAVPTAVNERIARAQRTVDPRIAKVAADVIVPYERLADLVALCAAQFTEHAVDGVVWGHISDGNLHPNVIPRSYEEYLRGQEVMLTLGRAAIAWGGSPCAEHGVGRNSVKQRLVRELYGDAGIEAMRRVKAALDPERRLAPGVLGL